MVFVIYLILSLHIKSTSLECYNYAIMAQCIILYCMKSEYLFHVVSFFMMNQYSVFGTPTCYGLDSPRIESQWRGDIPHPFQTGPQAYPPSGRKSGWGVALTNYSPLALRLRKGRCIPLPHIWSFMDCYRVNCPCCTCLIFTAHLWICADGIKPPFHGNIFQHRQGLVSIYHFILPQIYGHTIGTCCSLFFRFKHQHLLFHLVLYDLVILLNLCSYKKIMIQVLVSSYYHSPLLTGPLF